MNTIREIQKINDVELERGMAGTAASWHTKYAESAWVYVGNLDVDLTEGDVICVMSQYGEVCMKQMYAVLYSNVVHFSNSHISLTHTDYYCAGQST
jgi:RNA recognition motif-containing protein